MDKGRFIIYLFIFYIYSFITSFHLVLLKQENQKRSANRMEISGFYRKVQAETQQSTISTVEFMVHFNLFFLISESRKLFLELRCF